MSFDLAFWWEKPTPSTSSAAATYGRLVEGELTVTETARNAALDVASFYTEVTAAYPEICEENMNSSPWASAIYKTDECVIVAISWSRADELTPVLCDMALRHGLTTFDPQSSSVLT
ncbi:hypothetical protein [Nocardioides sp. GCM10030258]|uniref:hypothetical protein n=1 Tax=unclassified Nocardioides TaxID=2615069 RepID=UPI003612BA44